MPDPDYLIKNCTAADFEFACPKQWSELKPSMMAAVRECDHCNRKVYLCTTDADLKIYTSLKYCIAVIKPQTPAEKERDARMSAQQRPVRRVGNQYVESEVIMGVTLPGSWTSNAQPAPAAPAPGATPKDLDAYAVPTYLRMPLPDNDEPK